MIIDPINNEIGKPWVLPLAFEQPAEKLQAVLAEVISKYLERHQCLVLGKSLCKKCQAKIIYIVVSHIDVHQTLVNSDSLCNSFCTIV